MKKIAFYLVFLMGLSAGVNLSASTDNQEQIVKSLQMAEEIERSIPAFGELINGFGARTIDMAKNIGLFAFGMGLELAISKSGFRGSEANNLALIAARGFIIQLIAHYKFSDSFTAALVNTLLSVKDIALLALMTDVLFESKKDVKYVALCGLYTKELLSLGYYGAQRVALGMLNKNPELIKQNREEDSGNIY